MSIELRHAWPEVQISPFANNFPCYLQIRVPLTQGLTGCHWFGKVKKILIGQVFLISVSQKCL